MCPDSVATVQIAKSGAFASPGPQMPLSFLKNTERGEIIRISGKEDVRKYLSELGFLPGTVISVVNTVKGNIIVDVKGSRVAIDAAMASKIIVSQ
ncbi:MAG: ferrous iron transport protein A [Candidatus Methanomethylophilaceae archaeon]|nr:ferrous iron transport protein A [Candidatus Methanomethylophilaceae archaeon]